MSTGRRCGCGRQEKPMKFKQIFFATFVLILAVSLVVYSRIGSVKVMESSQGKTITFKCPAQVQVGPVNLKGGWEPEIPLIVQLGGDISIVNDNGNQQLHILCQYGKAFPPFAIDEQVPAGYACKVIPSQNIGFPSDSVTCVKKIPVRPSR